MERKFIRRNEKGAVLLTVLCIMTVMIVLVGAAITFVNSTTQKTYRTFQAEQAYMTASTCLESFVNEIDATTNSADKDDQKKAIEYIEMLADENGGKGYEYDVLINGDKDIDKMGSCTIRVSRYNANTLIVTAVAKFGQETDQCAAYIQTKTQPKKADFTNAIELCHDNDCDFNNLNVIGDMASITGTENKNANYNLTNQFKVYGRTWIYGNVKAQGNGASTTNWLMPSRTQEDMGSSFTISGNFTTNNDYRMRTALDWGLGYNFLNVGETFKVGDSQPSIGNVDTPEDLASNKEIDIFCHNAVFNGGSFKQKGNLYVYKNEGEDGNGNLTVENANAITIWGDAFVEGNIYQYCSNDPITINGKLEICGDIFVGWSGSPQKLTFANGATEIKDSSGKVRVKATDGVIKVDSLSKEGRAARPEITETINEYEAMPEDILQSDDSQVGLLKTKYEAFYNGTCTKTLGQICASGAKSYTDENGTTCKFATIVEESCTIEAGDYNLVKNNAGNTGGKILIHITDQDILIRLKSTSGGADKSVNFIVKNDSDEDSPKFCYFVSDSGISGSYDASSTAKNKWTGFDTPSYTFDNSAWLDYYTYVAMFDDTILANAGGNLVDGSPAFRDKFVLNATSKELTNTSTANYYTPKQASTVFLFTKGTEFILNNASFFEAIFYGPDAKYVTATQGINGVNVATAEGADGIKAFKICSLGMIIAGNFKNSNESTYLFKAPLPGGALDIVKGARSDTLYGYKLLRYDHH